MSPAAVGNQIFVSVHQGNAWPPRVLDLRAEYGDSIGLLRSKIVALSSVVGSDLVLFLRKKELLKEDDHMTLTELEIHTGFSIKAWDIRNTDEKDIWPPIKTDQNGRRYIV